MRAGRWFEPAKRHVRASLEPVVGQVISLGVDQVQGVWDSDPLLLGCFSEGRRVPNQSSVPGSISDPVRVLWVDLSAGARAETRGPSRD